MPHESLAIFFLVHGTFARGAEWVKDDSPLCEAVRSAAGDAGSHTIFESVSWSGRNSVADRLAAAGELDAKFRRACIQYPDAHLFFIGHSHGGSVVSYFWRGLERDLRCRVSGAAFLSTPFIATRMRPGWQQLVAALATAIAILVFLMVLAAAEYADANYLRWSYDLGGRWYITVLVLAIFLIGFLVAAGVRRAALRWGEAVDTKVRSNVEIRETTRLPEGNNIFLRTTGDEAALALAVGQIAISVVGWTNLVVSRVVVAMDRSWRRLWDSFIGRAAAVVGIVLYGNWITGTLAIMVDKDPWSWRQLVLTRLDIPTGIAHIDIILERAVLVLSPVFFLLSIGVLGFMLWLLIGLPLCLLALWAAGWTGVKDGLFTAIAIEPVPLGTIPLHHLDWNAPDQMRGVRRHSYTYSNPAALKCISDWISQTLRRPEGAISSKD